MDKAITEPVKAEGFTGSLRSLDADNLQECIVERIDEMLGHLWTTCELQGDGSLRICRSITRRQNGA